MTDSQELARRFNEDEAVWQRYEYRRRLHHELGIDLLLPEEVLDELDWLQAECECREIRCVGKRLPSARNSEEVCRGFARMDADKKGGKGEKKKLLSPG